MRLNAVSNLFSKTLAILENIRRKITGIAGKTLIKQEPLAGRVGPVPNGASLMCRTKLNTVRLWSHFGATADSDGVLESDLIREGHGNQFSMRTYAF